MISWFLKICFSKWVNLCRYVVGDPVWATCCIGGCQLAAGHGGEATHMGKAMGGDEDRTRTEVY